MLKSKAENKLVEQLSRLGPSVLGKWTVDVSNQDPSSQHILCTLKHAQYFSSGDINVLNAPHVTRCNLLLTCHQLPRNKYLKCLQPSMTAS